jgi:hypothetical protein
MTSRGALRLARAFADERSWAWNVLSVAASEATVFHPACFGQAVRCSPAARQRYERIVELLLVRAVAQRSAATSACGHEQDRETAERVRECKLATSLQHATAMRCSLARGLMRSARSPLMRSRASQRRWRHRLPHPADVQEGSHASRRRGSGDSQPASSWKREGLDLKLSRVVADARSPIPRTWHAGRQASREEERGE